MKIFQTNSRAPLFHRPIVNVVSSSDRSLGIRPRVNDIPAFFSRNIFVRKFSSVLRLTCRAPWNIALITKFSLGNFDSSLYPAARYRCTILKMFRRSLLLVLLFTAPCGIRRSRYGYLTFPVIREFMQTRGRTASGTIAENRSLVSPMEKRPVTSGVPERRANPWVARACNFQK